MKSKPIKVDWDAVEDAFSTRDEELLYYLDRITGHVVLEGEEDDFDEDEDEGLHGVPAPADAQRANDQLRLYIHPPDTATKVEWMRRFLERATGLDPVVIAELKQALEAEDPGALIVDILSRNAAERDAWYLYRAERVRELIGPWLEANGVVTTERCPWG